MDATVAATGRYQCPLGWTGGEVGRGLTSRLGAVHMRLALL